MQDPTHESEAVPVHMFLKLAGIDGESVDAKHKGEVELAWSWGLSESPPQTGGGGGGAGKVKAHCRSTNWSISLLRCCSPIAPKVRRISDGTLTARQESKGAGQEFLVFKMTNVLTSVTMAETSKDEARPTETVTLNFAKLDFDYRSFKQDGGVNQEKSFRWDFSANKSF